MHDIDRTLMEYEPEMNEYEEEYEADYETEYDDEYEDEYESEAEYETEAEYGDSEAVFDEQEEMELAAELLGISDEAELDYFLGKVFKRVGRKARKFVKSRTGRRLKRLLRKVAKKVLPIAGRAAGTYFGGPAGGAIGGTAGTAAGRALGLELEGLSPEDQEFEVAKRVVRLAGDATKKAAIAQTKMPPDNAAKAAVVAAAKKHAPGLLRPTPSVTIPSVTSIPGGKRSGRWMRRGSKIVLIGV